MLYVAIDPGNIESAWVLYDTISHKVHNAAKEPNAKVIDRIINDGWYNRGGVQLAPELLCMEMIESMGMAVGLSVFHTCVWIGRFLQAWEQSGLLGEVRHVTRRQEKLFLCGTMRAKDKNIRQAVMDRYGNTRQEVIGKKKTPGPLYGIANDMWAALAVAITGSEGERDDNPTG